MSPLTTAVASPWTGLLPAQLANLAPDGDLQRLWLVLALVGLAFSILPAILALFTSFTRILLVLTFLRQALGVGEVPPDKILAALALFLTLYTMTPVLTEIDATAVRPFLAGRTALADAAAAAGAPLRRFMLRQTRQADLMLFSKLSGGERPRSPEELGFGVVVPAFVLSELKTAFQIGVVIYLPFLILDLLVATTITSLGLSGLNPASASAPCKLLLFSAADGWNLVVSSLVQSVRI